ncbi:MAG: hypothetical protein AAFZ52_01145 [Bacteroidota bacterium]
MSRKIILPFLLFLGSLPGLYGQWTVTSTSAGSGITYHAPQGESQRVVAGTTLPEQGKIVVQADRKLNLVYGNKKISLEGPADILLTELKKQINRQQTGNFLGRFWKFISSSVTDTSKAEDVENYHRKYMTNTRAGIRGFGKDSTRLALPEYFSGRLTTPKAPLRWSPVAGAESYRIQVRERDGDGRILEAVTRSNGYDLQLDALACEPAAVYVLEIGPATGKSAATEAFFTYEPGADKALTDNLLTSQEAELLTEEESALYFAYWLEKEQFHAAARTIYENLLVADPDNRLYRKTYASFLVRMDVPDQAREVLKSVP